MKTEKHEHLGVEIVVQVVPQQAVDENCLSLKVIPALGHR